MFATDLGDAPPQSSSPAPASVGEPNLAHSRNGRACSSCQRRKVKCDGLKPCSACVKGGLECVIKPTVPPLRQRPKKFTTQRDVISRLRWEVDQLIQSKASGADPQNEAVVGSPKRRPVGIETTYNESRSPEPRTDTGRVILEQGHPRYVDNNLWTELEDALQIPNDVTRKSPENVRPYPTPTRATVSSGESLLFGRPTEKPLISIHPQPVQIFRLWQICLDNVNPLVKLFHAPTVQQLIIEASSDLENVNRFTESLMFAIYLSSVTSLGDEECRSLMGDSKALLLARFSGGTQQALINAEVLSSSNPVVLQAYTLFLLSMRQKYDPQTLWTLTGLAIRMGQRIGLHRENISQRLSPFEAEMRRRLWWQILILDRRSAQLCGAAVAADSLLDKQTKRPLNINDSDLNPAMKELPVEHAGVTEMLFCTIRYEIGGFMNNSKYWETFNGNGIMTNSSTSMADKDKVIDELENFIYQKFLKFCDPSISLHLLATYLAKGAVCQIRLAVHHPRQYADKGENLSKKEKDVLFTNSLRMVEYDNLCHATPSIRGYLWHIKVFFPFEAFIYVLGALSNPIEGELAIRAWQHIEQAYGYHPELITDTENPLCFAIGNLAIKAWEKRIGSVTNDQGQFQFTMPPFISTLQSQRHAKLVRAANPQPQGDFNMERDDDLNGATTSNNANQQEGSSGEPNQALVPNHSAESVDPMDWTYWQALLECRDLSVLDDNGQPVFLHI